MSGRFNFEVEQERFDEQRLRAEREQATVKESLPVAPPARKAATTEEVMAAYAPSWSSLTTPALYFAGWREAERHHGIGEERAEVAPPARGVAEKSAALTPKGYHAGLERAAEICDAYGMPDGTSPTAQLLAATIRAEVRR